MLHWNSEDYGANVARRRYAATLWADRKQDAIANIPDPCLPVGLIDEHFVGTGNYKACLDRISSMLATNPLPVGMKLPKWALSESYVGLSEYWYTTADVFFTGGRYNSFSFSRRADAFVPRIGIFLMPVISRESIKGNAP